ncbi:MULTISPECIES: transposase [unclassified Thermosynechococcus]|uniref:transposase n=1 Tax=unclassified Thermosynechococcus TaxID=2622553 RepID=UPI002672B001|nr:MULTISPECIES: transposase [unclassified Thermosynechococcus]WKT85043.1 IS630 transposase-related protein [Thermosynechococcus sp. HY596]WNC64173.1 IS630 transposase-related protein [Thermosynechococcus sp. HY591]WNC66739.1 IS630 transposase-related protein [Thermosynechococcus sp. HY593]
MKQGGKISEATQIFQVSRATIHRWLKREDLAPTVVPRCPWKLDWAALAADVAAHPDDRLIDRAQRFGVQVSTISYALAQMGITRKKKQIRYQERCEEERQAYQQQLDTWVESHGEETVVSIDETGFDSWVACEYGWSARGQRIDGERAGKRQKRESLVAGRYRHQKDFIASMLFSGYLNALGFVSWLSQYCLPALEKRSLLMMDNAPIHPKGAIQEAVKAAGHEVLFLPKYSLDLNVIEHDFSALKRARMYAGLNCSMDEVIRKYYAG